MNRYDPDQYDPKKLRTPDDYANLVRLLQDQSSVFAIIIFEGDTDSKFYRRHLLDECQRVITDGRDKALATMRLLYQNPNDAEGVLAILDADFDRVKGVEPFTDSLIFTDTHDLESMIFQSWALEKVINEFVPGKDQTVVSDLSHRIREDVLRIAVEVGYIRWVSEEEKIHLGFAHIPFMQIIKNGKFELDDLKILKNDGQQYVLTDREILEKVKALKNNDHDPWQISQGHDICRIFSVVFSGILNDQFATKDSGRVRNQTTASELSRSLRLSYEYGFFQTSTMYLSIRTWENVHSPFKVLRESA